MEYLKKEREYKKMKIIIAKKERIVWIRTEGIGQKEGEEIINQTRKEGKRPEALRIAKMIGKIKRRKEK